MVKMSYAKLLGIKGISDVEIMKILAQKGEIKIGETIIRIPDVTQHGVSGDFGEPAPK
jgi:hypothetical protein